MLSLSLSLSLAFPMGVPYVIMRGSSALGGALLIPTIYHVRPFFSSLICLRSLFFTLISLILSSSIDNVGTWLLSSTCPPRLLLYTSR